MLAQRFDLSSRGPLLAVVSLVAIVVLLVRWTQGTSLEEQYAGKRVLRVSFEMNLQEINEVWTSVVADFEARHPDVAIVLIDDINQKAAIYEAANMLPDIIATNTFSLYRYRNALLPLDSLLTADAAEVTPDDFYPQVVESCRLRGRQVLVPYFFNVSLLYYNIDMFEEAGVPLPTDAWSWDDYVDHARRLTQFYHGRGEADRFGTTIVPGWWVEWLAHVHQAGGRFIGQDWLHSPMDSPEAIEGLRFFHDLVRVHRVSPEPKDILPYMFVNQRSAMEWGGHTENWVGLRKTATFRWDVAMLPHHPSRHRGSERVAVGVGINRRSEHRELAWEFIKHLSSRDNQARLCRAGYVPVRRSVAEEVFFERDADGRYVEAPQNKAVIFEAYRTALRDQSLLPEFSALAQRHALPHIADLLSGELTPEQTGAAIAEEVTNAMKMIGRRNPEYDYAEAP
jgi:multiple sugar transport system substrate-binding protein